MTRYEALIEARDKLKTALAELEKFLEGMTVEEAKEVVNERHTNN